MNKTDWEIWNNLTFKTLGYRKNFDLISRDENIITLYDGMVSEINLGDKKPPHPVGEYGFSVWNIELGNFLGVDLETLIEAHSNEDTYKEFYQIIKKNIINAHKYDKIVFVHTFIINKEYRKHGLTEEFVEMLYRDFYSKKTAIIMLVEPFQDNPIDFDFYYNIKKVEIKESLDGTKYRIIPADEYYSLDELLKKDDKELNEYKLFNIASKCGFVRIDESHLFIFNPEKIRERLKNKVEYGKQYDNQINDFF